jgi:hypothetical protein
LWNAAVLTFAPRIGFQEFSAEASDAAKEAQQRFKGSPASVLLLFLARSSMSSPSDVR